MTGSRDPLAAFDEELLAAVAAERDVTLAELREFVRRHQQRARELPGVEELVYDWRSRWPYDPVVVRTDAAYYLADRASVWPEFGDQMALDEAERAHVEAVHDRQVRQVAAEHDLVDAFADAAPMLLVRP